MGMGIPWESQVADWRSNWRLTANGFRNKASFCRHLGLLHRWQLQKLKVIIMQVSNDARLKIAYFSH